MSNIGKQPINIPDDVNVSIENSNINVKGPLGELNLDFDSNMSIGVSFVKDVPISVDTKKDLLKECVITINDIAFKRVKNPFQAFDAQFVYKLLGKKLNRNLNKDQILKLKHLK